MQMKHFDNDVCYDTLESCLKHFTVEYAGNVSPLGTSRSSFKWKELTVTNITNTGRNEIYTYKKIRIMERGNGSTGMCVTRRAANEAKSKVKHRY